MSAENTVLFSKIATSSVLFISISMLLTHFFNDSDRHRVFLEKMRAKYLLSNRGPEDTLFNNTNDDDGKILPKICKDYLLLRGVMLHFGSNSTIIVIGLALMILTTFNAGYLCFPQERIISFLFWSTSAFLVFVQNTFIQQQRGAARRLKELRENTDEQDSVVEQFDGICCGVTDLKYSLAWLYSKLLLTLFKVPGGILFITINVITFLLYFYLAEICFFDFLQKIKEVL